MKKSTTTNTKLSTSKILALYRKGANNENEAEVQAIIEKLQQQCKAHGKALSDLINFKAEHHKIDLFTDISADGTLVPKAAQTLYMLMGKYIKLQLKSDITYFDKMTKEEVVADVLANLHPESKYRTKDPISCIKWYKAQIARNEKKAA